jgi:hypothetical protein
LYHLDLEWDGVLSLEALIKVNYLVLLEALTQYGDIDAAVNVLKKNDEAWGTGP